VAGRLKRVAGSAVVYVGIVLGTLVLLDLTLIVFGLFPPTHDYGDPEVGWVAARPSGEMREDRCMEFSTREIFRISRNEDALRTSRSAERLRQDDDLFKVAVTGDSQTELCAPNPLTHFGVLERELTASGMPSAAYAYGAGKYAPLQAYLAVMRASRGYATDALVLNFYTGNDFLDMLRVDDRPHFAPAGDGYTIAAPVWFQLDDPTVRRRSRVLYALRTVLKRTGLHTVLVRVRYHRATAAAQGKGLRSVLAYMNDLRKSASPEVGYAAALTAQMLNQQLFFHRFPDSKAESLRRVRALFELVRREHPEMVLVLSPLPSYQLVREQPVDDILLRTIERLPITYESGVREEGELYEALRVLAAQTGWRFADNLAPLRAYAGTERLFNDFDYHYLPPASDIIGRAQAAAFATPSDTPPDPSR